MSLQAKQVRVAQILDELRLTHVADSRIGNAHVRGVSGGERRRVSIGMELVTSPQILFLDEPTSGLDSSSANSLMLLLKQLAHDGNRIVVLSVHQPSKKSFLNMDQIILLAKGKVIFSGPTTSAASYFASHSFPCPLDTTIADHILDVASAPENIDGLHTAWNAALPSRASQSRGHLDSFDLLKDPSMWKRSFVLELQVLFLRTGRNLVRNKSLLVLHVVISMILALISGIIFTGLQLNLAGFQNRMGAMYFILTFFGFGSLSSMELFIAERALFVKESGARYYSALSYFLAKSMLDLATLRLLPAFLFAVIFYYIMGLNAPVDRFLLFTTTLMLYNVAAGSLSIFLSIVSKNVGIANLLATVVLLVMILFGGFLLNVQTMPAYVAWLQWFSIFKYAFEIMMTNELSGLLLTFDAPGYPSVPVYGEVFLQTLGFDLSNQMRDVVCLIVIAIVLHVISFALLASQVPRTPKLHLKDKKD